jgi:hypothetical protein
LFFDTAAAYQRTEVLRAALQLDVFEALADGACSAADLSNRCATSERGMRVLCDTLTVLGFLTKSAAQYALTLDSASFLLRRSPTCVTGTLEFLHAAGVVDAYRDVATAVRKAARHVRRVA